MIGFEFDAGQFEERGRLALALFGANAAVAELAASEAASDAADAHDEADRTVSSAA
jgi:hypothetical protein